MSLPMIHWGTALVRRAQLRHPHADSYRVTILGDTTTYAKLHYHDDRKPRPTATQAESGYPDQPDPNTSRAADPAGRDA